MKSAAELIVHAAGRHLVEGELDHVQVISIAARAIVAQ